MRTDLTDITVVLDRSGSMASCRADAEGGLNTFIDKQKKEPGSAIFTLVQFDDKYDFVHRGIPISEVPKCTLEPRGSTALLDAVGKAIAETGQRLKAMPENQRPGLVVFVIVTDGGENSSVEYRKDQIKQMIALQQNVYKWQFTFLGANQDAFAEAGSLAIHTAGIANYEACRSPQAFAAAGSNVARMRQMTALGQDVINAFTDEELKSMK